MSRLQWRCRRGTRELDRLLQRYLSGCYAQAGRAEQEAFERLLELPDPQLQDYFMSAAVPADPQLNHVVQQILAADA